MMSSTPHSTSYRMPAEWEPHQATWLSWPHNEETWPADRMPRVQQAYAQMVAALAHSEMVHINVNDAAMETHARGYLRGVTSLETIQFHHIPTNDAWCRDHGAIFVVRSQPSPVLAATDWEYNAWGGKYPPFDLDNQVPARMAEYLHVPRFAADMVLEGGSIEVNGTGLLLTTEACLLNPNRNPHLTRSQIEQRLCAMLGIEQVLWLGDGIVGDDTDGHIDDLARFVAADTIVTSIEDDPTDANYAPLQENYARLQVMRNQQEQLFQIVTLPMPPPVISEGVRLPATYVNFYIANRVVLLPFFNCATDQQAQRILQSLFPTREVIGIDCTDIIWGLGALHCLTQQVPQPY